MVGGWLEFDSRQAHQPQRASNPRDVPCTKHYATNAVCLTAHTGRRIGVDRASMIIQGYVKRTKTATNLRSELARDLKASRVMACPQLRRTGGFVALDTSLMTGQWKMLCRWATVSNSTEICIKVRYKLLNNWVACSHS